MAHRKYENPKQGFTQIVPRRKARRSEFATQEDVLSRGGIVAGPYGTPGFRYHGGEANVSGRPVRERKTISSKTSLEMQARYPLERQPITVSHREDGHGTGAFWDHYTLRRATQRGTAISHHRDLDPVVAPAGPGKRGQFAGPMPGHEPQSSTGLGRGLLFIAGGNYGLNSETPRNKAHVPSGDAEARHKLRGQHETYLLQQAKLTGRPVLSVCGGSWRVLESFGGSTRGVQPNTHQTRKMPYLTTTGAIAKVASEHGISISPGTMLSDMFKDEQGNRPTKVNSAHWAVAEESAQGRLKGVALVGSTKNPLLQVSARGPTALDPPYIGKTGDFHHSSVEAFESRHGAPIMGIQWHPEAYDRGFTATEQQANHRLLNSMAKAGDTYDARREMTADFSKWVNSKRLLPMRLANNKAFQVARRNTRLSK